MVSKHLFIFTPNEPWGKIHIFPERPTEAAPRSCALLQSRPEIARCDARWSWTWWMETTPWRSGWLFRGYEIHYPFFGDIKSMQMYGNFEGFALQNVLFGIFSRSSADFNKIKGCPRSLGWVVILFHDLWVFSKTILVLKKHWLWFFLNCFCSTPRDDVVELMF